MNQKKTILVTGATAPQGGSVAKALLAANYFNVRILTRNPHSPAAISLKQQGAAVEKGDMLDIHSLRNAMLGCYGVFGITDSRTQPGNEYLMGQNLADAVNLSGIEHFVLVGSSNFYKLSHGRYAVARCDTRAALEHYSRSLYLPATFVRPAFYYEDFIQIMHLQQAGNDSLYFNLPLGDAPLALVSVQDLGAVVASIFNHPKAYIKRVVGAVGADDTGSIYAAILSRVFNKTIYYNSINRDAYAALDFAGAAELANLFEVHRLHISNRQIDLVETYALNPRTQSFENWLLSNQTSIKEMLHVNHVPGI